MWANALAAVAVAITCLVLLPSLRMRNHAAPHPAAIYDFDQAVPPGYVSLPFADPALPLDDATVLPVELTAEDLELMGIDPADAKRRRATVCKPKFFWVWTGGRGPSGLLSSTEVHLQGKRINAMKKTLLFGSALLLAVTAAVAQNNDAPPPPRGPGGPPEMRGHGGPPGEFMGGIEGRTVTGSPFSAQIVSTSTQTLSDGSHISRNVNATVARDSQGRTYRQQTMENLGPVSTGASKTVVFLRDPVAHTSHVISMDSKTAVMSNMPQHERGPRGNGPAPSPNAPQAETGPGRSARAKRWSRWDRK